MSKHELVEILVTKGRLSPSPRNTWSPGPFDFCELCGCPLNTESHCFKYKPSVAVEISGHESCVKGWDDVEYL